MPLSHRCDCNHVQKEVGTESYEKDQRGGGGREAGHACAGDNATEAAVYM